MFAAVVLLLALLQPSVSDDSYGYLPFLDSLDADEFRAALNAREVVNKLISMGAACSKEEEDIRERYSEEERIVLKQYAEGVKEMGPSDEAYQRLVTDLLEAEEGDVERVRAACVSRQREYLLSLVKEVLEYYSFLSRVDPTKAATFLQQADKYWENIRVGLDQCRQLYAKESDGLPPEVFSEEKMCRTEEVELLLEAFQSFVEQAAIMEGKLDPLEGYLPGILPVIPDNDDGAAPVDPTEVSEGPTEVSEGPNDVEAYLPGILPVIPDNGQGNKDDGKPTDETKEPTEETKKPTEETKEPTEETKKPTEETKEPTEETKESTEEAKKPTEDTKKPTEETKEPTEETKEPTEETKEPTEVSDELKDLEAYLPGILPVIPDWSGNGPVDDVETSLTPATEEETEATEDPTEVTEGPTEATEGPAEATEGPTEATEGPTEHKQSEVVYNEFDWLDEEKAGSSDSTPPLDTSDGSWHEASSPTSARPAMSPPTGASQLHRSSVTVPSEGQAEEAMHLVIWTCVAAVAMVLLAMVGVCVLALLVRRQRSRLVQQEPPLLKEKRHLSMMKETGYINPTYRFHELQDSKENSYY